MRTRTALKWATVYHLAAFGASVLGLGIVAVGLFLGLQDSVSTLTAGSLLATQTLMDALSAANPIPVVLGLVVGLFVRRVGRTTARLKATAESVDDAVDTPSAAVLGREVSDSVVDAVDEADATVLTPDSSDDGAVAGTEDDGDDGTGTDDTLLADPESDPEPEPDFESTTGPADDADAADDTADTIDPAAADADDPAER